jgi:small conductance mechanosensitive channel
MDSSVNYLKSILLNWQESVLDYLPKVFLAVLVLAGFYLTAKLAKKASRKFYAKTIKNQPDFADIISSVVYFFFILSGVFLALQIVGLEKVLTKLLAGAGIVGIIAGFAFKDVASNIFSGLLLRFQKPFRQGDWVKIDGNYGQITDVGWITTNIKTVPGQEVFVPNQVVYSNTFANYSTYQKRRVILETGVSYGDDLAHVKAVALDEVKKVASLLPDEEVDFYFTEIGGATFNFQLRFWIAFQNNTDFQTAMSDIIMRVKKRFEEENISIAYPVTTLDFGVKGGTNLFDIPINIKNANQATKASAS